jgi:hypothetical protein
MKNGLERRWAIGKSSNNGIPGFHLWVLNVAEEKLSVGQGARDQDSTKVEEFGGNGGVVLESVGDDV